MKILSNNINKEKIIKLTEHLDLKYNLAFQTSEVYDIIIEEFKIDKTKGYYGSLVNFSNDALTKLYIKLLNLKNKYEK